MPNYNPVQLKPKEVVTLINSVDDKVNFTTAKLLKHRQSAGLRISDDGKTINLVKYAAWLTIQFVDSKNKQPELKNAPTEYEIKKQYAAKKSREISITGRDIGCLPDVVDPKRKEKCRRNFQLFCELYFPLAFYLSWSDDHIRVIKKIEQAVLYGGLFANAMPRGSGKSVIAEIACIWAICYGHRDFIALIGSDEGHACDMLDSIKTEFETNELLYDDFPEICYPIVMLDGIANRCAGQTYKGKRTAISWTASEIVLPTIEGSLASAAIIRVAGITGRIRGMKFKRQDGKTVRPSLVILDDPQTDESARSLSQCANRERILAGAILGLAGPGKKISGIMPCTVVCPGDMADRILDRTKHPEWNGERTKMVYKFPANTELWAKYAEIRADSLREHGDIRAATAFYKKNKKAMDVGAEVAWKQRFNEDELSALQNAMNLKLQNETAFWAEYQNEPLPIDDGINEDLSIDDIARKINGYKHSVVPIECNSLTMFVDVQGKLLYYAVCAWEDNYTGYVIDYGAYPKQRDEYFTLNETKVSLQAKSKGSGLEGAIYAGLVSLLDNEYLPKEYTRDDGSVMQISKCLVDANWGQSTDVVYQFCRQSKYSSVINPSHGKYVGASSKPFSEYKRKRGDKIGHNWRMPAGGKRQIRHVLYDTNFWKSFLFTRFATNMGDKGCLSLFGSDPVRHRMISEHITAEYRVKCSGRGREVDEWKMKPDKRDNHLLDCLVGCCVAANMTGVHLGSTGDTVVVEKKKNKIKLSELRR